MLTSSTLFLALLTISICAHADSPCKMFNLGDSNTDTGAYCTALAKHSSFCRASDGKVYLDFLGEKLGMGYLSSFLDSLNANFTVGANFAVSGSGISYGAFPLSLQAKQFAYFRYATLELPTREKKIRLTKTEIHNAIFSVDIGQNDLPDLFLPPQQNISIDTKIIKLLVVMEKNIKMLYDLDARKIVIYGTGPFGCLPFFAKQTNSTISKFDKAGCMKKPNQVARAFNRGLKSLSSRLRRERSNATILYIDMYKIKYDLVANPSKYGFENPLAPCPHGKACSQYVFWDDIHYTQAASKIIASKVWSGKYTTQRMKLNDLCDINIDGSK